MKQSSSAGGGPPVILLVSDDAETRRTVAAAARTLLPDGSLHEARAISDARELARRVRPSVILLDSALAAAEENPVSLLPERERSSAVILIADQVTEALERALADGASGLLVRNDLTPPAVAGVLQAALGARRSAPAADNSSDALRIIISRLADGIVIVDELGITRFVNPAAELLFGRAADELIGEEFGFPLVSGETAEFEILHPRDGPVHAELRVTAIEWDGAAAHLAAIRDVTERVRAQQREKQLVREQALRAAAEAGERRARFLGEAARILSSSLDYRAELESLAALAVPFLADWCIIDLIGPDGMFERVAVATASDVGTPLLAALRRVTPRTDSDSGAARVLRSGEPQLALGPLAPAVAGILGLEAGHPAVAEARLGCCMVLPLTARDRRLGLITLCDAESERVFDDDDLDLAAEIARRAASAVDNGRLYMAAQQANQVKADFLAVMSHELRTPLNAVIGYSDLLLMGIPQRLPEHAAEQVRRIRTSARHLLSLIEEILTFSRIEAGREELHLDTISVQQIVDEVTGIIEPLALEKGLSFRTDVPDELIEVATDPQKLRQVLLNLLSNAVKFTDHGSVSLTVSRDRDDVSLCVADTGHGISEPDLPRIFEPFWQAEQSRTRRAEGTGLGLAVARRLVHLLGGDLFVQSRPGVGSSFTVLLHVAPPASRAP